MARCLRSLRWSRVLLKYFGKRLGGWMRFDLPKLTYYFYFVKSASDEAVHAKVITNT